MAYSVYGVKCKCGVVHYVIAGDATRGELRSLRERLQHENTILHYVNDEQASIKCICGAVVSQDVTESDT